MNTPDNLPRKKRGYTGAGRCARLRSRPVPLGFDQLMNRPIRPIRPAVAMDVEVWCLHCAAISSVSVLKLDDGSATCPICGAGALDLFADGDPPNVT